MCGRGGLDYSWSDLWAFLNLVGEPPADGPRVLNLAPSLKVKGEVVWSRVPVVLDVGAGREMRSLAWPLVPGSRVKRIYSSIFDSMSG